jgi:hypothetical protein
MDCLQRVVAYTGAKMPPCNCFSELLQPLMVASLANLPAPPSTLDDMPQDMEDGKKILKLEFLAM